MFHASKNNIDDLLREVFARLLGRSRSNHRVENARKGSNTEVFGALLELTDPRARLSRSQSKGRVFSALGELFWYLSGSNRISHIEHYIKNYQDYSDDGGLTASGAYGPRIFGESSQYNRIIKRLTDKPDSRNAVIQIFSNADAEKDSKDIPCTTTLQFVVRNKRLHLNVSMRSNDAFRGLPHDIFAFTMIQEIMAHELKYQLGTYQHSVGSLHLYDDTDDFLSRTNAQRFLDEDFYEPRAMPKMPDGNQWPWIKQVLEIEESCRAGSNEVSIPTDLPCYWADIARLFVIHAEFLKQPKGIQRIRESLTDMKSDVYRIYVFDRLERSSRSRQTAFDFYNEEIL